MNSDIYIALISGSVTILVGLITAISAYQGSMKGVRSQIKYDQDIMVKREEKQKVFIKRAIEQFILNEVKYNFHLFDREFKRVLSLYDNPVQYAHGLKGMFRFEEFNRFKGELIKQESDLVKDLIRYYNLFYRINYSEDFLELSQDEFEEVKKVLKSLDMSFDLYAGL